MEQKFGMEKVEYPQRSSVFYFTSENFHLNHAFHLHFNWKFWLNGKPSMVLVDSWLMWEFCSLHGSNTHSWLTAWHQSCGQQSQAREIKTKEWQTEVLCLSELPSCLAVARVPFLSEMKNQLNKTKSCKQKERLARCKIFVDGKKLDLPC